MNFALTDEQEFLRDAAKQALGRFKTIEAARGAVEDEPEELPDLWPTAKEAGWPGLLISEEHDGAGLGALEAMLVMQEAGKVLAGVPLIGHVTATAVLSAASDASLADLLKTLAAGDERAALVPARPPSDIEDRWLVDPEQGIERLEAPTVDSGGTLNGKAPWVIDAPGAEHLVVVATDGGTPKAVLIDANAQGVTVDPVTRFDGTRSLAHVSFDGATGQLLDVPEQDIASAWYLAQGLVAAESLGGVETALERSVQYAKERFTFGRPIGSYQAIKHQIVEILRLLDNSRSLMYYAGWARQAAPDEFPLAASAFRVEATKAFDHAARTQISVHGGIGATWEHDAPYFFRRAQLSRRLLGGLGDASDRVASELLIQARAGAA